MNDGFGRRRRRSRSLLIVEGKHEKDELFGLMFKCFPELSISMDDVWIYGTNIYRLYEDITEAYGSAWAEEKDDIDLPFVISKKQHPDILCYKNDFTNIILVFDYERHDVNFSERKILEMQKYFADEADMGKLYINYPMIESYQHLKGLPDCEYSQRKIPVSLQPGKKYKALVNKETMVKGALDFLHRVEDLLKKDYEITDEEILKTCCDTVFAISDDREMVNKLQEVFRGTMESKRYKTLSYQLKDWITKLGYVHSGQTYWEYMREIFKAIIYHNICKANRIQNGQYEIEDERYKEYFERLNLTEILDIQNACSREDTGYIWVLNTCVFFVAEYNFTLVTYTGTT